jgi:hypothetical protein
LSHAPAAFSQSPLAVDKVWDRPRTRIDCLYRSHPK